MSDTEAVAKPYSDSVRDLPPPIIYKFRAFDLPDYERDADIIVSHNLWAGSPSNFNDPLDCMPVIDLSGTRAERIYWAKKGVRRNMPNGSRRERRVRERSILRTINRIWNDDFASAGGLDAWRSSLLKMAVVCFSENADDMLLWSHYGASHQGYCLGFETVDLPFMLANRVRYSEERPTFKVLSKDRSDLMERLMLQKAAVWGYEREWRIVRAGRVGRLPFPSGALKEIVLGARISPKNEEALRDLADRRAGPLTFKRAILDSKTYQLSIVPA
jgi:hypothetical protein